MSATPVMLVAGGTGSIGRVIVRQALAGGWAVVLHGSNADSVAALLADFPDQPVAGVAVDISQSGAAEELVARAIECFQRLDAVVDCVSCGPAGGGITGSFATTNPDRYLPFFQLSLVYQQQLAFAALPALQESGGTLVVFASDAARFAAPRQTMIGSARAGTVGFVRNLAMDVARDGVRIHCVCPGFVDETAVAQKLADASFARLEKARARAGLGLPTPEDIAPTVLFLCGDGARKMTGQVISINGGINA